MRILLLLFLLSCSSSAQEHLTLPSGFRAEVYAEVPGARHLAVDQHGTVYVGTARESVYAVPDRNKDFQADEVIELFSGLNGPNGVAVRGDDLYVAEIDRIRRYPDITMRLKNPPSGLAVATLPGERLHGLRPIKFGPDGWLYVGVGAPVNVGEVREPRGTIARMKPDGSGFEVYARGIRNSMGFDWHPSTRELWFTDNGRDMMGDDLPPEELNVAPRTGMHFGFPYMHGRDTPDPRYAREAPRGVTLTPPVMQMEAHVAPLGMHFYRGTMFPREYRGRIFIANHGSWNRSSPLGYRVLAAERDGSRFSVFCEGWLAGRRPWGRPVDITELRDGSLIVSDDHGGKLWRITYR